MSNLPSSNPLDKGVQHGHKILDTISQNLGVEKDYDVFDINIITAINASIFDLDQLFSFQLTKDFSVETGEEKWSDYVDEATFKHFAIIPTYIYMKTRLIFDPPTNAFTIEAIERQITRMEFRLTVKDDELLVKKDGGDTDV